MAIRKGKVNAKSEQVSRTVRRAHTKAKSKR